MSFMNFVTSIMFAVSPSRVCTDVFNLLPLLYNKSKCPNNGIVVPDDLIGG